MNDNILVSVVMTAYNEEIGIIKEAIDSILNQTYDNFELIIVLDNPNNTSLEKFLYNYSSKNNFLIYKNPKNLGQAKSANKGIDLARGKYIARMDADDVSHKERLAIEIEALISSNSDMVFTRFNFIDENGILLKTSQKNPSNQFIVNKVLSSKNIITQSTVMFKKEIIKEIGGYSNLIASEDYEMWLRILNNRYKIVGINEITLDYRVRKSSVTTSDYYKTFMADRFIKNNLDYNLLTFEQINSKVDLFNQNYLVKNNNSNRRKKFNIFAKKYFSLINSWSELGIKKYFLLLVYIFFEPRLVYIFLNTTKSNVLRRR
ncbi:glycosyltransferase family 2 protein [Enterococcus bulliens]